MSNIYEKIVAFTADVKRIEKNGELDLGGRKTKFLAIDDVLEALKPLFDKHRIVIMPFEVSSHVKLTYGQDNPSHVPQAHAETAATALKMWTGKIPPKSAHATVVYEYTLVDADNPESQHVVKFSGEAMDSQDKATQKAITSAYKSMLIKVFRLRTGEPELEEEQAQDEAEEQEKLNTGQQKIAKAKPTAEPSVTPKPAEAVATAPPTKVAKTAIQKSEEETKLDVAKKRLRDAVTNQKEKGLIYERDDVDKLGMKLVNKERPAWIQSMQAINKIAKAIEDGETA